MIKQRRVTLAALLAFASYSSARAEDAELVKPLESYQVESQYGPANAVLNPIYSKDEKFELGVNAVYSPFSSLYNYGGVAGSLVYHVNRRHAIEPVWFQYNFGKLSNFAKSQIADKTGDPNLNKTLGADFPRMMLGASYLFTPYYVKMHLTDLSVVHLDFYGLLGIAGVYTQSLLLNGNDGASKWQVGGDFGLGMRVNFKRRHGIRVELRDFIHPATQIGAREWTNDIQVSVGYSIFLGQVPDYNEQ